jgi:hypothetical protein
MKKYIYILIICLLGSSAYAQLGYRSAALEYYQNKDYVNAARAIDSAIIDIKEKEDPYTWHIRGFIYKDTYKYADKENRNSSARPTAIESFYKSMELDKENIYKENNVQGVKYLASKYWNDVVATLDTVNYKLAIKSFALYKENYGRVYPTYDFTEKHIQFYNALAGIYNRLFDNNINNWELNRKYFGLTLKTYRQVAAIDSLNYRANYNLGILYHNEGVDLIVNLDPTSPLDSLISVQNRTVELFKIALPYMLVAHEQNPKKKETILGLAGIYFNLNEKEKSDFYNDLIDEGQNKDGGQEEDKK